MERCRSVLCNNLKYIICLSKTERKKEGRKEGTKKERKEGRKEGTTNEGTIETIIAAMNETKKTD